MAIAKANSLCNTLHTQFQFDSSLSLLTTYAPTTERNIDHEFLSASLILLYMYVPKNLYLILIVHFNERRCD